MDVAYINRIISTTEKINVDSIETYTEDYHAGDFGDNDLINKQAVIELIGDITPIEPLIIPIPATSAYPLNINVTDFPEFASYLDGFKTFKQVMIDDSVDYRNITINDVVIHEIFTDSTKTTYASLDIYGHDSGDNATTIDNLIVTLYK